MSEVTVFSNEKVRPFADQLAQTINFARSLVNEWDARPDVHPPNDATPIGDGSGDSGDGRPEATGAKVTNIITRAMEFLVEMDKPGVEDTILQMAVNTTR